MLVLTEAILLQSSEWGLDASLLLNGTILEWLLANVGSVRSWVARVTFQPLC